MIYITQYTSPIGELTLSSNADKLTGIWFEGQKYYGSTLEPAFMEFETPAHVETKRWLDSYFRGEIPDFTPPLHLEGSPFRIEVWNILLTIPYGNTMTYGDIALRVAKRLGKDRMSPQAVGGAVGHNPIGIIVPCHRVVGSNGSLTGYAGGLDKKVKLLTIEHVDISQFFLP